MPPWHDLVVHQMEPRRRFRILKELAEGAFGKVYLAEMITGDSFKSVVAIKLLHGKWLGHQEIVQRSRDEARVLGLLHHRNIVRVEDLTSINGQCAVIMEYLEGVDLKNLIRHCRERQVSMPRKVAFEVIGSTSSALDAAFHQKTLHDGEPLKLIHRDIKPSNVMLTVAGEVKVLDFGTARAQFEDREAETQALAFGSAAYMSPERMMGDPDAPGGDVFALGITLFELLRLKAFGKIYIREEKFGDALDQRIAKVDLSDLPEDRAEQVRSALRLMLAYDPGQRPSAAQVVELMEALAEEVQDGSLRRFCREVVLPCHQAMEYPVNPDDPFMGSTLFEDTTRVRQELDEHSGLQALKLGPAPTLEPEQTVESLPLRTPFVGEELIPDDLPTVSRDKLEAPHQRAVEDPAPHGALPTYPPPPLEVSTTGDLPEPPTDIGDDLQVARAEIPARQPHQDDQDGSTGRIGLVVGIVVAVVVSAIGGASLLLWKAMQSEPKAVAAVEIPEERVYNSGGEVHAGYKGKVGTLVFGLQGVDDARVTISGNQNDFSYRWNGLDGLTILGLEPGLYRVSIRAGEVRLNLESRVVRRRTCTYEYNLSSGKQGWTEDGCN